MGRFGPGVGAQSSPVAANITFNDCVPKANRLDYELNVGEDQLQIAKVRTTRMNPFGVAVANLAIDGIKIDRTVITT